MRKMLLALLAGLSVAASPPSPRPWQVVPTPPPMPRPSTSGYAEVNGIRMYHAEFGSGTPLLLIHLGEGNADQWSGEIPLLARHHQVIIADTRGHGRSGWDGKPLSYKIMADDYVALLDQLHIKKAAVVGVSDGAIIGLQMAMSHPERLTKLFAQGANATPDAPYPTAADPAASHAATRLNQEGYRRLSPAPARFAQFHSAMEKLWSSEPHFTKAELAAIRTPTAIVMSDHDEWIPPAHARYIASSIPNARLMVLRNVSHYAALQDPKGYAAAILSFIDRR